MAHTPNAPDRAVLRLTAAYAVDDDGSYISPPKRRDGSIAITGAQAVGATSTSSVLTLNVHGISVALAPATNTVTITHGAKSRSFRVVDFSRWTISDVQPTHTDPQFVEVDLGAGTTLEIWALYPGVVRIVAPNNRIRFVTSIPPNASTNADLDPLELNADDWYFVSDDDVTITSGAVSATGTIALLYEEDADALDWRHFLHLLPAEFLRILPTGAQQYAQVFWLAWWARTYRDNQELLRQLDFDTMSGEPLRVWARRLGVEPLGTETDARLRLKVKGRILKRHGIVQPDRIIRAIRAMIGTSTPGGITLSPNFDSSGVWQARYLRVTIAINLLEDAGYALSEYTDVINDIKTNLEDALGATIRLVVETTGGAAYDAGDLYDGAGGVYGSGI